MFIGWLGLATAKIDEWPVNPLNKEPATRLSLATLNATEAREATQGQSATANPQRENNLSF